MATIDYKEKYETAIKQAKEELKACGDLDCDAARQIFRLFPELKESEDEKIKSLLISSVKNEAPIANERNKELAIAWLEKQGEKKPTDLKTKAGNWYICDMEVMNENMTTAFHRGEFYYCPKDGYIDVNGALFEVGTLDVFRLATEKEIPHPKQKSAAWSEEDDAMLQTVINRLELSKKGVASEIPYVKRCVDWLKSLEDRYTWNPSDEQMLAINTAINVLGKGTINGKYLIELQEQLKKLKS